MGVVIVSAAIIYALTVVIAWIAIGIIEEHGGQVSHKAAKIVSGPIGLILSFLQLCDMAAVRQPN